MTELPHTLSCFVCGEANPIGLRMRFQTDGQIVTVTFTPRPEHIGFKDTVHGGLSATLLDEMMVWACAVNAKRFAYCAELNVRFLKPLRPNHEFVASAELKVNRRNKLFEAAGEIRGHDGESFVTATGKYLSIPDQDAAAMATDFVGDWDWIFAK